MSFQSLTKKQKKIFNISVDLFYDKGYTETSVRDIAEKLKIQAASLYAHISSKEQILEWISQHYVELVEAELFSFKSFDRTYTEKIRFIIRRNLTLVQGNIKFAEIFRRYFNNISKETQKRYIDFSNEYAKILTDTLEHFQVEKHIQFDPVLATKFLMFNFNNAYKWVPENLTTDQIIDIFENKIFFGFTGQKLDS